MWHLRRARRWPQLSGQGAAEHPEDLPPGFDRQGRPEPAHQDRRRRSSSARGGTVGVQEGRMVILLAGLSADAPGSIRPVPAAPTARLWARRRRIFDEIL